MKRLSLLLVSVLIILSVFSVYAENEGVRYEAEEAELYMCNNSGTHAAQIDYEGSYVNFDLYQTDIPGIYKVRIYYCAAMAGTNTHTLFVNDEKVEQIIYPATNTAWGTFSENVYVETEVTLKTGSNYIRLERTADDTGFAELDAISLIPVTLYTPEPTPERAATETPSPAATATPGTNATKSPTGTTVDISEEGSSFNILYVIIPVAAVAVIVIVIIVLKKKR